MWSVLQSWLSAHAQGEPPEGCRRAWQTSVASADDLLRACAEERRFVLSALLEWQTRRFMRLSQVGGASAQSPRKDVPLGQ